MIQWTPERLSAFKSDVERARKARKTVAEHYDWDGNLARYVPLPKVGDNGTRTWDVNVGADFQDVERKKAALFYDVPAVNFVCDTPSQPLVQQPPPQPGQPPPPPGPTIGSLVAVHQKLVNGLLGHERADAKACFSKLLFDILCPAGVGVVNVGYDAAFVEVEVPQRDPATGQPVPNPLTGQPMTQKTQVPIHEDWYLARISPYAELLPSNHKDTDSRRAPWVGFDFEWPLTEARRRLKLPPDWEPQGGGLEDKPYYKDDDLRPESDDRAEPVVTGCVVQYRPALLAQADDPPYHPLLIADLILIDGEEQPVKHDLSPHQQIGPDGRLTPDSITDFTIKRLTLRDRTDQAYVPSDCTVTAPLTKELNKYRSQTVQLRDANIPLTLYDSELLPADAKDKIEKAKPGDKIPLVGGALQGGVDKVAAAMAMPSQNRENWTGQDYIERDRERILGIGSNQVGVQGKGSKTATEVQTVQRNTEARFSQEEARVRAFFLDVVRLFDTLVIRYCDARAAGTILGMQAGAFWAQHKQALAGAYRHEIQIDSGTYQDTESDKRQWLQLLNMIGQSPNVNAVPVLKRLVPLWGLDPAEVVIDQPPQKKPELKATLSVSADQLNPSLPQFGLVIEALSQAGYQFSPEAIQAAKQQATIQATVQAAVANTTDTPTPQPGTEPPQITETLPKMPTLNQKQSEESGARTGPKV